MDDIIITPDIWRDIPNLEGYQINCCGIVRSIDRYIKYPDGHLQFVRGRTNLHQTTNPQGYKFVKIHDKKIYVHILVALCFVDGWFEGAEVDHKDLDKSNNYYTNLEWVTHAENQRRQHIAYGTVRKIAYCEKCGKQLSRYNGKTSLCIKCLNQEKVKHIHYNRNTKNQTQIPPQEFILQLLLEHKGNFEKVGRIFDVSGNTVRHWCKRYNMSFHSKDYAPEKPVKEKYIRQPVPVKQIDKQSLQVVKIWDDYLDAQKELGLNHIKEIIEKRSHRKSEGGYLWELA